MPRILFFKLPVKLASHIDWLVYAKNPVSKGDVQNNILLGPTTTHL